ncbi:unnamed protein product [Rhizoctonia solani]|uniref:Uncharacterized protein n=1 Tax=Rhizoctonia solani TaxID=456999 RepID=A0A8H3HGF6_9AGAM|nr:unnamed protein product [Rhizoctonia solani]
MFSRVESIYNFFLWFQAPASDNSSPFSTRKEGIQPPTSSREGRDTGKPLDGRAKMLAAAADAMGAALLLLPEDEGQVDNSGIGKNEVRVSITFSESSWKGVLEKGNQTIVLKGSSSEK